MNTDKSERAEMWYEADEGVAFRASLLFILWILPDWQR
jgi:hypothetical protein